MAEDPRIALATWPDDVQAIVRAGRIRAGMTRPQVLMPLGHPAIARTPSLDAGRWSYNSGDDDPLVVVWDADGHVVSIQGPSAARQQVLASGG